MIYNNDTDGQDIVSLANDFASADNNNFPIKQKTRFANKSLRTIWSWIFSVYGGWLYDDSNNTDFPSATTTLNINQTNYGIPTGALTIRAVDVKLNNGGTVWQRLEKITEEQIRQMQSEPQFLSVPGQPMYYEPYGNSIKIYPPANYTQTASLRVSFDRGSVAFASTDTMKTPGFASEFHEGVAIGMANDFCTVKKLSQAQGVMAEWQLFERKVKAYYSQRFQEMFPARMTILDSVREYQ
jgi:hypothetical protein